MVNVLCTCCKCGNVYNIQKKEYNRKQRNKTRFFCSSSCAGKSQENKKDKTYVKTLKSIEKATKRIKEIREEKIAKEVAMYQNDFSVYPYMFKYYIRKSKTRNKRKISCEEHLTEEYLCNLWIKQNGKCVWTGIPLVINTGKTNLNYWHLASLDRIDSKKPYEEGNVQFVCLPLNYAKGNKTDEELVLFLNSIKYGSNS